MLDTITFDALARRYCERNEYTPEEFRTVLQGQKQQFQPLGWMLLECQM